MEAEKTLRRNVALANRIIECLGLSNAFGHVSARIPGTDTFLIPTRRSPRFADENTLLVLDTDGNVRLGTGSPNSELWIHARTYAARPDVGSVVHAHPPGCVCLTQIGEPHRVVHNQGGAFLGGVPEYERIGLIRTRELGDQLAQRLGSGIAVTMRGHGITTAGGQKRRTKGARLEFSLIAPSSGAAQCRLHAAPTSRSSTRHAVVRKIEPGHFSAR